MAMRDKHETASRNGKNGDGRSTVRLLSDIGANTGTLVKKELELFKIELLETVSARAKAAAAFAVVGVLGLFVIGFFGMAGAAALSNVVAAWLAYLIVGGVFMLVAVAAVMFAKRKLKMPPMKPEQTMETVKEDVEWAKAQLKR